MATLLTKRSNTAASVPLAAQLTNSSGGAELAVNTADKRLFTKDGSGNVVELGTAPSSLAVTNSVTVGGSLVASAGAAGTPSITASGDTNTGLFFPAADTVAVATGGTERVRVTSAGDVGVGTSTPANKLNVFGSDATIRTESTSEDKGLLLIKSGVQGFAVTVNGAAQRLDFSSANAWPSISQIMSLTAAGNVGIGTSSPGSNRLYITAPDGTAPLTLNSAGGSDATRALNFNVAGDNYGKILVPSGSGGAMAFWTGGANAAVERARIDSSGNFIVGGTAATNTAANRGNITLNGASSAILSIGTGGTERGYIFTQGTDIIANSSTGAFTVQSAGASPVIFGTSATERARIDSGGSLLLGKTSYNVATEGMMLANNAGNPHRLFITKTASGSINAVYFYYGSTYVGGLNFDNTSTSLATSSDYRLKQDVENVSDGLAKVCALRPVYHKWNSDVAEHGHDQAKTVSGFIAHEVQDVFPDAVFGQKDAVDDEGNIKPQTLDYSKLVPMLTAAIQELKAELDATKAELAALKGQA